MRDILAKFFQNIGNYHFFCLGNFTGYRQYRGTFIISYLTHSFVEVEDHCKPAIVLLKLFLIFWCTGFWSPSFYSFCVCLLFPAFPHLAAGVDYYSISLAAGWFSNNFKLFSIPSTITFEIMKLLPVIKSVLVYRT